MVVDVWNGYIMKKMKGFVLLVALLSLTACKHWWGGNDEDDNPYQGVSAEQLYQDAKNAMSKDQYSAAIKRLEALDTMYPFNDYAESAQIDLIYAYYKKEDYPSAAATAERFIHLYPRTKRVDYAYYMKAMSNFHQTRGALANIFPVDNSWRDPGSQSQAYSDFATLVQQFPASRYKANALQHMIYLRNMFAKRELNAARYYYQHRKYVAAVERAGYLVKTYPQAPTAQDALSILYYANLNLGLTSAANEALTVYRATYHSDPKEVVVE
jgi:outer membrane protein assembly factor BamD